MKLGVNIDHIATLRNARAGDFPSPLYAAFTVLEAGAFNVTCHLREDRRHIKESDIRLISEQTKRLNLEMAANDEIISIALDVIPRSITLVPEKRQELTTEGGLNVALDIEKYKIINNKFSCFKDFKHFLDGVIKACKYSVRYDRIAYIEFIYSFYFGYISGIFII